MQELTDSMRHVLVSVLEQEISTLCSCSVNVQILEVFRGRRREESVYALYEASSSEAFGGSLQSAVEELPLTPAFFSRLQQQSGFQKLKYVVQGSVSETQEDAIEASPQNNQEEDSEELSIVIIIAAAAGGGALLIIIIVMVVCKRKRVRNKTKKQHESKYILNSRNESFLMNSIPSTPPEPMPRTRVRTYSNGGTSKLPCPIDADGYTLPAGSSVSSSAANIQTASIDESQELAFNRYSSFPAPPSVMLSSPEVTSDTGSHMDSSSSNPIILKGMEQQSLSSNIVNTAHTDVVSVTRSDSQLPEMTAGSKRESVALQHPSSCEVACALHNYVAPGDSGLSFKKGELIQVTQKTHGGWWLGKLGEHVGWFPSSYTELMILEESDVDHGLALDEVQLTSTQPSHLSPLQDGSINHMQSQPIKSKCSNSTQISQKSAANERQSHKPVTLEYDNPFMATLTQQLTDKLKKGGSESEKTHTHQPAPLGCSETTKTDLSNTNSQIMKVLYEYHPVTSDGLALTDNEEVFVSAIRDDGWAYGSSNGRDGWFPAAYVQPVEIASGSLPTMTKLDASTYVEVPDNDTGIVYEDLSCFQSSDERLFGANGCFTAQYAYQPVGQGDLELREGDIIQVLERSGEWWLGRIGIREGWFPGAYTTHTPEKYKNNHRRSELPPPPLPPPNKIGAHLKQQRGENEQDQQQSNQPKKHGNHEKDLEEKQDHQEQQIPLKLPTSAPTEEKKAIPPPPSRQPPQRSTVKHNDETNVHLDDNGSSIKKQLNYNLKTILQDKKVEQPLPAGLRAAPPPPQSKPPSKAPPSQPQRHRQIRDLRPQRAAPPAPIPSPVSVSATLTATAAATSAPRTHTSVEKAGARANSKLHSDDGVTRIVDSSANTEPSSDKIAVPSFIENHSKKSHSSTDSYRNEKEHINSPIRMPSLMEIQSSNASHERAKNKRALDKTQTQPSQLLDRKNRQQHQQQKIPSKGGQHISGGHMLDSNNHLSKPLSTATRPTTAATTSKTMPKPKPKPKPKLEPKPSNVNVQIEGEEPASLIEKSLWNLPAKAQQQTQRLSTNSVKVAILPLKPRYLKQSHVSSQVLHETSMSTEAKVKHTQEQRTPNQPIKPSRMRTEHQNKASPQSHPESSRNSTATAVLPDTTNRSKTETSSTQTRKGYKEQDTRSASESARNQPNEEKPISVVRPSRPLAPPSSGDISNQNLPEKKVTVSHTRTVLDEDWEKSPHKPVRPSRGPKPNDAAHGNNKVQVVSNLDHTVQSQQVMRNENFKSDANASIVKGPVSGHKPDRPPKRPSAQPSTNPSSAAVSSAPSKEHMKKGVFKALVNFKGRHAGDLSFEKGDMIVQLTEPVDGICKGMKQDGTVGKYRVAHVGVL